MNWTLFPTCNRHTSYGVPAARSLAFAAPGPLCAVVIRSQARIPSIRFAPARFRIRGQGHATAHRVLKDIQALPGDHTLLLSGQSRVVWVLSLSAFPYGKAKVVCMPLMHANPGETETHQTNAEVVRCDRLRSVPRARHRTVRVNRAFCFLPLIL